MKFGHFNLKMHFTNEKFGKNNDVCNFKLENGIFLN